jgi:hypothetical protein
MSGDDPDADPSVEPRVEMADFGVWSGSKLFAEYDAQCDTVRVNARAVERARAAGGAAEAERFINYCLEHEIFHRTHPAASEDAAHAYARSRTGDDRRRFEALLRAAPGAERA